MKKAFIQLSAFLQWLWKELATWRKREWIHCLPTTLKHCLWRRSTGRRSFILLKLRFRMKTRGPALLFLPNSSVWEFEEIGVARSSDNTSQPSIAQTLHHFERNTWYHSLLRHVHSQASKFQEKVGKNGLKKIRFFCQHSCFHDNRRARTSG